MSTRRGRPRTAAAADDQGRPSKPASIRYRIVIQEISDAAERLLVDYTVDGHVAAIGRRLPSRAVEHKTLRGRPLDLTIGLAGLIPAMAEFIGKASARAVDGYGLVAVPTAGWADERRMAGHVAIGAFGRQAGSLSSHPAPVQSPASARKLL